MRPTRTISWLLGTLLLTGAGSHSDAPVVRTSATGGTYRVDGSFETGAGPGITWAVLSDYGHIAEFVSSIQKSAVRQHDEGGVLVEQEMTGKLFVFSRRVTVLLKIREEPGRSIVFHDVLQRDFESYDGSWSVEAIANGSRVVYRLLARPKTGLPALVGQTMFTNQVSELLGEVRTEIERRTAHRIERQP